VQAGWAGGSAVRHSCLRVRFHPSSFSARWHKLWFCSLACVSAVALVHSSPSRFQPCVQRGGTIKVHKLTFKGVKAVDTRGLKAALATARELVDSWVRKPISDRLRFDADLQRVQAFYSDRGYPDAASPARRQAHDKQDRSIDRDGDEGEPVRVAASISPASTSSRRAFDDLKKRAPLKVGEPRDRQIVVTTHEWR